MDPLSRGLLAGVDVETLRRRLERKPYQELWRRMNARREQVAARCRAAENTPLFYTHASLAAHSISPQVVDAGLAFRLTGDLEALAYVEWSIRTLSDLYSDVPGRKKLPGGHDPVLSNSEIALAADLCRGGLKAEDLARVHRIMRERAIDAHDGTRSMLGYSAGRNIPVCRTLQAGICALVWGEEAGHPGWREVVDLARDAAILYLRRGVDAGGFGYEGPGYSLTTFFYIYLYAQLLLQAGRDNLFASEPALSRIPEASLSLLFPDGQSLGNINDLGLLYPHSMPWLPLTARYYHRPADLSLWYAYQGPEHPLRPFGDTFDWLEKGIGVDGNQGCYAFPYVLSFLWWDSEETCPPLERVEAPVACCSNGTEMAAFRTSWSPDAVFASIMGSGRGHVSGGHAHADCGHFAIFAHGEYLAVDTGRYNTDEDQHNVMLVDGACHMPIGAGAWGFNRRSGRLMNFQRHALLDYVMADAAHMKNCIWADRHMLFVRGPGGGDDAYLVMVDNINVDNASHNFAWQLHTDPGIPGNPAAPGHALRITGPATASVEGVRARLDITFARPDPADFPDCPHALTLRVDEKEWAWPYGVNQSPGPAPRTGLLITSFKRPRLVAELTGGSHVMAVMAPRRAGAAPLAVRQIPERRVMRVEVDHGDCVDTILAALDHGYVALGDLRGWSELAVIRRDRAGRVLARWDLDDKQA